MLLLSRVCFSCFIFARVLLAFAPPFPNTKPEVFSVKTNIAASVSDDGNDDIPKRDPVGDIRQLLESVKYDGYHFTHGIMQDPRMSDLPIVDIENCGRLPLPVSPEKAKQLIDKASLSPFGLGNKTVVDDQVRKSWQFEPQQVKINDSWTEETLNKIVDQVKEGLGMSNQIEAVLHKLLIYEEGSFFKGHVDSQKLDGMFGTLSVQLPSLFEGGSFKFEHLSHSDDVDLSIDSEKSLKWIAWYGDTFHEIAPLTSGYRVALVYNLVRSGPTVEDESSVKNQEEGSDEDQGSNMSFDYVKLLPKLKEKIQEWQLTLQSDAEDEGEEEEVSDADDDEEEEELRKGMIKVAEKNKMIVYKLDHKYTLRPSLFDGCISLQDFARVRGDIGDFEGEISGKANEDRIYFGGIPRSEFAWIDRLNGRDRNVALLLCRAAAQNALNVSLVLQDMALYSYGLGLCNEVNRVASFKVLRDGTTEEIPWLIGQNGWKDDTWCIIDKEAERWLDEDDNFNWAHDHTVHSVDGETTFGNEGVDGFSRYRVGLLVIEPPAIGTTGTTGDTEK